MSMANIGGAAGGAAKGMAAGQQFNANQQAFDQNAQMNPLQLQMAQQQLQQGGAGGAFDLLGTAGLNATGMGQGGLGASGGAGGAAGGAGAMPGGPSGAAPNQSSILHGPQGYQGLVTGQGPTPQQPMQPGGGPNFGSLPGGVPVNYDPNSLAAQTQGQGYGMSGGMPDFFNMGTFGQGSFGQMGGGYGFQ